MKNVLLTLTLLSSLSTFASVSNVTTISAKASNKAELYQILSNSCNDHADTHRGLKASIDIYEIKKKVKYQKIGILAPSQKSEVYFKASALCIIW